ncbi:glycoside hydrolase family 98 domain-containing protein [Flavobacterium sp. FlaQc-48]|uniref:glycoside hydrolase family 98 domain-containing protein n=1 Tax=Flavobacterium sp. FlaQc-48 TaxID=3374181 RepID=UPI003756C4BB
MIVICFNVQAQNKPEFQLRGLLEILRKGDKTNAERIVILNTLFPKDIRGQMIYSLGANCAWYYTKNLGDYSSFNTDTYLDLCKRVDSTGIKFVVDVGEKGNHKLYPDPPTPIPLGRGSYHFTPNQVDSIFKYAKNCVGIESGENFWTYNSTNAEDLIALLRVCKKYNKRYTLGEGGWGYNTYTRFFSDYYTTLKNEGLGAYLQPAFKNTKPFGALVSQGSIFGSWLTGLTGDFGTWNDEYVWTYASFGNANDFPAYDKTEKNYKKVPFTHYLKAWLLTIAMGGKINFMETSPFSRQGVADANCAPYLFPFIKGLADHDMLPGKAAVLAKVKAIANPYNGTYSLSNGTAAPYTGSNLVTYNYDLVNYKPAGGTNADPFARLFKITSGIWNNPAYTNTGVTDVYYGAAYKNTGVMQLPNALIREQIPNNPRYLIIPLLPHPDAATQLPSGLERIDLSAYQTDAGLKRKFESLYPAVTVGNDAWAVEIDNRFFVINSHENADIDQNFVFNLGTGGIKSLSGAIPFQNILFGKRESADNYWFQSNGYAVNDGFTVGQKYVCVEKSTTLNFSCERRPMLVVEDGKSGSVKQTWNTVTKVLKVTISHEAGAVSFSIFLNKVR